MRILFLTICLTNIAFAFGSLPWMPDPMAVHFALDGRANGFAAPLEHAVMMSVTIGILTATFLGSSCLMSRIPNELINLPNRDYWLNAENRPKTIRRVSAYLESVGNAVMLFFLAVQWEVFQANQTVPPHMNSGLPLYGGGILTVWIVVETVRVCLAFRRPA